MKRKNEDSPGKIKSNEEKMKELEKEVKSQGIQVEKFKNFEGKFKAIIFQGNTQVTKKLKAKDGFLIDEFGDVKYIIASNPIPEKSRGSYKMIFYVDGDTGLTFEPHKPDYLGLSPITIGALFDDRFIRTVFKLDVSRKTLVASLMIGIVVGFFGGIIF